MATPSARSTRPPTSLPCFAVEHIDVAGGVDRHPVGPVEAGERQHGLGVRPGRQLQHLTVADATYLYGGAAVGDVYVASAVHPHPLGEVEVGEWQHGLSRRWRRRWPP